MADPQQSVLCPTGQEGVDTGPFGVGLSRVFVRAVASRDLSWLRIMELPIAADVRHAVAAEFLVERDINDKVAINAMFTSAPRGAQAAAATPNLPLPPGRIF